MSHELTTDWIECAGALDDFVDELLFEERAPLRIGAVPGSVSQDDGPSVQVAILVSGRNRIAVPVLELGGISERESERGDTARSSRGARSRCINLRQILSADTRLLEQNPAIDNDENKLVLLGSGSWAISCRAVEDIVAMPLSVIAVHSNPSLPPWLQATEGFAGCPLLDCVTLHEHLQKSALCPLDQMPGMDLLQRINLNNTQAGSALAQLVQ